MTEKRGSIGFFTTYRPPLPLDIFSRLVEPVATEEDEDELPTTKNDELCLLEKESYNYNYNGQEIPKASLKTLLTRPKLESKATEKDVDLGHVTGMVFVSERTNNLETLHLALRFHNEDKVRVEVFNLADVLGMFKGARMEDSGCFAGDYLVYVTTKDPAHERRQPWTTVYKTHLGTGKTDRLTPPFQADLSPSVSLCGTKIAVASFQRKCGWNGEREDLGTDIFVMNVETPYKRRLVVLNGGWPTWGSSEDVIYFHRKEGNTWGVFRAVIPSEGIASDVDITRVTPVNIDAITPAAIDDYRVAAVTIEEKSDLAKFTQERDEATYRHIEIFRYNGPGSLPELGKPITRGSEAKMDHYNPFVMVDNRGMHIGYHRCKNPPPKNGDDVSRDFDRLQSPQRDVGLSRVSGVFPTFSKDGSKLAFVDNDFKNVLYADSDGLHHVYKTKGTNKVFSPVWNQDPDMDTLYVCMGPSFDRTNQTVHICAFPDVTKSKCVQLTKDFSNNAFPSTNPEGTKLVFRSTRVGGGHKNLFIMEDAQVGEFGDGTITRLTNGPWIDTHCKWSPQGDWIVFSSNRDRPKDAPVGKEDLDSGYFGVYLVKPNDPTVVVRVLSSGIDFAGHVNHPFFSPDGKSLVVTSDLAAVSVDPISLPHFLHSARPYGDIFTVDIDPDDIKKNENVKKFTRMTHSRYENATGTWTMFSTQDLKAAWNFNYKNNFSFCPFFNR